MARRIAPAPGAPVAYSASVMFVSATLKQAAALAAAGSLALALAACGNTVTTGNYKGAEHEVALTIANLQSDATAAEQGKICTKDLAAAVVQRLGGTKGCESAVKDQLKQVDNLELTLESVKLAASGTSATATVKSTSAGKKRVSRLSLVKQEGQWRIASLG